MVVAQVVALVEAFQPRDPGLNLHWELGLVAFLHLWSFLIRPLKVMQVKNKFLSVLLRA